MATSSIFISSLPTSSVISETAAFPLDQNGNTYQVTGNLMLQGLYTASSVNNIINTIITPNFNSFTSSYKTDSSSFNTQISALSSSYRTDSSSFNLRIISGSQSLNTYSSSIGVISSSFDNRVITTSQSLSTLSSSYRTDSSSFDQRVITTSQSLNTYSSSIGVISSSFNLRIISGSQSLNTYSSSIGVISSSFDQRVITTSQSLNTYSSSIGVISSSFNLRIISGSQSLNTYSSSIGVISSSFDQRIITTSQSLNTYTPTSSFNTLTSSFNTLSQSIQLYDSEISIYSTGSTPPILGTDYNINGKVLNITNVNKFSIKYPELYNMKWGQTSQTTGNFRTLLLSGSVIFAGNDIGNGIYSSSNGGVTWSQTSQNTEYFLSFLLSGSVIFAGSGNGIYLSSNGGNIWSQTSQNTGYFYSLILSGSTIFAGSVGNGIYSSSNGGVTWGQTSQTTGIFTSLMLSGSVIFAGSGNGIYSSSNGGNTWSQTSQNTGGFSSLILSGNKIFAVSDNGIYSSSNGGNTWGITSQTTGTFTSLLLSGSVIFAGNLGNGIYSSSNGGNTWSQTSQTTGTFYSLLLSGSVIFAGSDSGIYSSSLSLNSIYENKIYISNNTSSVVGTLPITDNTAYKVDSSSFDQRIITTSQSLNTYTPTSSFNTLTSSFNTLSQSIQLYDSEISIYSTGSTPPILGTDYNINGKVLNITNVNKFSIKYPELYNMKWGQTSQTTGNFRTLLLSGSVIFAGSGNGIYLSSNGGNIWSQTSQTTGTFYSLLLSGSVIFAGNYFNNLGIYSSSNGGVTWSQTSKTTGNFSSFLLSGSVIFAGNNSGLGIYSSSNGGVTWSQTSQTTGNFISLLLSGSIIFAGSDNGIYSSSNGGSTWGLTSQNTGTFTSLLLSGSVIFAGGVGIYSSSNGGVTWGFTSFPLTEVCRTLLLLENKIIVGSDNGIYSSSNGGVTWGQTSQNTGNFYSLLLSGSVIFAGSQNNGIYSSSLSLNSIYENKIYISNNTSSVVGTIPITDNNAYKVDSSSFDLRSINNSQSLNIYSSSIGVISSSFDQRIITTSQSLNTYTPTSSFNTLTSSFNTLSQSIQLYDSEISIYSTGSTPPILGTDYNINNKILNIINNNKFSIKYPELYNMKWGQTSQTTGYFSSFLLSGSVIFAGSGNMGIYSSYNGGVTWGQTSQNTGNFYSLILSGSVIFAGSQNNGIYSSSNGGNTWSQTSQNTGTFNSLILSGSVIFAGSQNNGIYSSSNGGNTWSQTSQNTGTFLSLLLSGSVIFAGSGNGIYLSSNGGNIWSQTSQNTGTFYSLLLSGSVIFAGSGNGIYLSSNGGNIWSQTSQNTGTFRAFLLSGSVIFAGSGNGIYSSSNGGVTWGQTSQNTGTFYSLLLSGSVIFAGSQNNGIYSSSLSLNSIYENKIYISNNTSSVVGTLPITDNNAYKVDSSSFNLRIISSSLAMRDVVIPFYTADSSYTTPVSGSDYNIVNNNIINTDFPIMSTIPIYGKYDNITFNNNIPNTLLYPNGLGLDIGEEPIFKYNNLNDKYYFAPYNNIGNGTTRNSGSIFIVSSSFNYSDTSSYTQSNFKYSIGDLSGSTSKYLKSPTDADQISSIFITGSEILATSINTLGDKNILWYSNDNGLNFTSINKITSSLSTYKISNLGNIVKSESVYFIQTWYSNTSYNYTVPIMLYNIHTSSISTDSWAVANATLSKQIASHENFQLGITGSLTWVYVRGHTANGTNPFILTSPNNINWTQKSDIKTALNGLFINITNFYDSCIYISNFNTFIVNILDLNNNPLYNIYSKDGGNSWNKYNIYVNPTTLEVTNNYSGLSNCQINDGFYSSELNSYITGGTYILKTQDGINFSLVSKNPNFRGKIALGKNNVLLNNVETITNGITTSSIYQSSISSIYKTNVYFSNLKQQPNNSKLELFSNFGNTYQLTGTPPSSFTWDVVLYSTMYISNQLTNTISFYLINIDSYVNTYNNNIELNLIFRISNNLPTINFYNSSLITINTSNGGGTTEHSTWQYVKYNFIYNNGNIIGFSQRL